MQVHQLTRVFIFMTMLLSESTLGNMTPWDLHKTWRDISNQSLSQEIQGAFPHISCFKAASANYQLPLPLLLAVARGESDFDAKAKSKANAIGIMQIQWPGTAKHLGIENQSDLYTPCINIDAGSRYLKQLLDRYGDLQMALAAYNYGPGRIKTEMNWATIPPGARWYSRYIYDHYRYITRDAPVVYQPDNKLKLLEFSEPFRAQAMTIYLKDKWPGLSIDWFENKQGRYSVVASFDDEVQRGKYLPKLNHLGF